MNWDSIDAKVQASKETDLRIITELTQKVNLGDVAAVNKLADIYYKGVLTSTDYEKAVELWGNAAGHGSAYAKMRLGDCYFYGEGKPENEATAISIYTEVLKGDSTLSECICQLGRIHSHGWGVTTDVPKGMNLLEQAWANGFARAATEIAILYQGMERTYDNVISMLKWYQRAAEAGDDKGAYRLGVMYLNGDYGLEESPSMAFKLLMGARTWTSALAYLLTSKCFDVGSDEDVETVYIEARKRADYGNAEIQGEFGYAYQKGTALPQDATLSEEWYHRAIENKHGISAFRLGSAYTFGWDGYSVDYGLAEKYLTIGAELGVTEAMSSLADLYDDHGYSIPDPEVALNSSELAIKWYIEAANNGNMLCALRVGIRLGQKDRFKEACIYYEMAAKSGEKFAYMPLVQCYFDLLNKEGVSVDAKKARKYLSLAIEADDVGAKFGAADYYVGLMYENGISYPVDLAEAVKHYTIAAQKGHSKSKELLPHFKKGLFGWKKV